jgi:hypothetical protein
MNTPWGVMMLGLVWLLTAGSASAERFALVPHARQLATMPVRRSRITFHGRAKGYEWSSTEATHGGVVVTGQRRTPDGRAISRAFEFSPTGKLEHASVLVGRTGVGYRSVALGRQETPPEIGRLIEQANGGTGATLESKGATWSAVRTRRGYDITARHGTEGEQVFRVRDGHVEALLETVR